MRTPSVSNITTIDVKLVGDLSRLESITSGMSPECPNCQRDSLARRGTNTLRNIRLRKKESRYDDFHCESCGNTFKEEEVNLMFEEEIEGEKALDW